MVVLTQSRIRFKKDETTVETVEVRVRPPSPPSAPAPSAEDLALVKALKEAMKQVEAEKNKK